MDTLDYIVVGSGIAGIAISERLIEAGKRFVVFDTGDGTATRVAGGVVNPVVLKRLNAVWKAKEFMAEAGPFYKRIADRIDTRFYAETAVCRIFGSVEEQNNWTVASDQNSLSPYLIPKISQPKNPHVIAPLGQGTMKNTFRVDTGALIDAYREFLARKQMLVATEFDHASLSVTKSGVEYKDYQANGVIFSEGSAVVQNPLFTIDALIPKKGEYLIFKSDSLQLDTILKGPYFVIPMGNNLYKAGATFAHGDTSPGITEKGTEQLIEGIKKMISCPFEVVDQVSGFRPTVKDRRPLLGKIEESPVYFFNGLGTRGLLMAPLLSEWLFQYMEDGISLPEGVDIRRYV